MNEDCRKGKISVKEIFTSIISNILYTVGTAELAGKYRTGEKQEEDTETGRRRGIYWDRKRSTMNDTGTGRRRGRCWDRKRSTKKMLRQEKKEEYVGTEREAERGRGICWDRQDENY
jgi:hypothetical protein